MTSTNRTRPTRMGTYRPANKSPRKSTRRATTDRKAARAFKYAVQGRS